ncbi:hypothetical protein D932_02717 [Enterococcus casseliflavus 14-MB-W-14]|nr:hypothetical protein D932_02717 [Enterococcus casseliflavus 14-MB-W-14]OJG30612.1 hypothetical protein RU99_GL000399 [Enterococcus casseliflavus]
MFQSFIHRRHLSLFLSCYEDTKQQVPLSTLFPEFSEYFDKKFVFALMMGCFSSLMKI